MGKTVLLTEETDWLGGQLTSQAVPPDEHPWIEQFGATRRYRAFREGVRAYYRNHFPLTPEARRKVDRIDLHPSTGGVNYIDVGSWPFQIPLGALIPVRVENLLPACKNLGVTHITNGCFRLHPVEWGIGEAAGLLAAFCLERQVAPRQVRGNGALLQQFQLFLASQGIELDWPVLTPR